MQQHDLESDPFAEPGDDELKIKLDVVWRMLRKSWWLIVAAALAVTALVTFHTMGQTKIYAAFGTLVFEPDPPRPLGRQVEVIDFGPDYWSTQEYYETQYQLMTAPRVTEAVVRALALHRDAAFLNNAPPGVLPPTESVSVETAAEILASRATVTPIKKTRMASLVYEDADPLRAQHLAQALIDTYIEKNLERSQSTSTAAVEWLNEQLDGLRRSLDGSEMSLHQFKLRNNVVSVDIDSQSSMLKAEMTNYAEALAQARISRAALESRQVALRGVSVNDPSRIPATELLRDSTLSGLRADYLDARKEHDLVLAIGKGENHPATKAAEVRVKAAHEALVKAVDNIREGVHADVAAARANEDKIAALLSSSKRNALEVNLLGIEYNRLHRTKETNERLYNIVLDRSREGSLVRMSAVNNVEVVEIPKVPTAPVRPRVPRNVGIGLLAGLILGFGLAYGRELLDRTVKSPADIENALRLPFLGIVPFVDNGRPVYQRLRRRRASPAPEEPGPPEQVASARPQSGTAEAMRTIRTNVLFMSTEKASRRLLITSTTPGEGKTMVACNLAITMAQAGQRVVLVDCDLRRGRLRKVFGMNGDDGLTIALLHDKPIPDAAMSTKVPNLSVVSAGPLPPNPAELLQGDRFERFLQDLSVRFDRVILDSPPVALVTDAAVLATRTDGVVVVVRAGRTRQDHVTACIRTIRGVGARIVGCVLNAAESGHHAAYPDYAYGYAEPSPQSEPAPKNHPAEG